MRLPNRRLHLPLSSENADLLSFADLAFTRVPWSLPLHPLRRDGAGAPMLPYVAVSSPSLSAGRGQPAASTLGHCYAFLLLA